VADETRFRKPSFSSTLSFLFSSFSFALSFSFSSSSSSSSSSSFSSSPIDTATATATATSPFPSYRAVLVLLYIGRLAAQVSHQSQIREISYLLFIPFPILFISPPNSTLRSPQHTPSKMLLKRFCAISNLIEMHIQVVENIATMSTLKPLYFAVKLSHSFNIFISLPYFIAFFLHLPHKLTFKTIVTILFHSRSSSIRYLILNYYFQITSATKSYLTSFKRQFYFLYTCSNIDPYTLIKD
jgi:hypothetical protein